ncbi:MAG: hypothetical protein DHS20C12_11920 [Pseudohongiella sp.]|nr:MAG: hypothetical protein DHS20C12_11920 [Pseudohongiella sp.]
MNAAEFTALVESLVRDDEDRLSATDIATAVSEAIARYSTDSPQELIVDVVADTTSTLPLPAGWQTGFSEPRRIEYPIGQTPPSYFGATSYIAYRGPSNAENIKFNIASVTVGQSARVTFTATHPDASTFHRGDTELVASYAAALLCEQLAAFYGHDTDSTLSSDSVDHNDKGRGFAIRAKSLRARYVGRFKPRSSTNSASAFAISTQTNARGGSRLFH